METAYWPLTDPASAAAGSVAPTILRCVLLISPVLQKEVAGTYALANDIFALPHPFGRQVLRTDASTVELELTWQPLESRW